MDLGSIKVFADSLGELHNSDNGSKIEIAFFVYMTVKRLTKPITLAVQTLAKNQQTNSELLSTHGQTLQVHEEKIQNHEKRIGVLEQPPTKE